MNRNFLKLAFAVTALAVLSGCATGVKHSEMASSMPSLKPGEGRIYFLRSASMLGAAVAADIRLNGQVVGRSMPGGFFYVDRPAGNHVASATTETETKLSFTLAAGQTNYIRSTISMGFISGRVIFVPESADEARAELGTLSYTGAMASK